MALRWYAARTQPRAELASADQLDRDGLEVFCPRITLPNPKVGHPDTPLFPGYLFVRLDLEDTGWPNIHPAHRLLGWVNFGGEIPSVPDEVLDELRKWVEESSREGIPWRRFRPGERVQIVSHNMQGLAEVVEEAKSPTARVKVLLHFMGRLVSAHVPWENLQPAEDLPIETNRPPRRTRGGGRWIQGFGQRAVTSG